MSVLSSHHPCLLDFKNARPSNEAAQGDTLQWLARMHTEAERAKTAAAATEFDAESFQDRMRKLFNRVGCSPERIGRRGYEIAEGAHSDWAGIKIYDVAENPDGAGSQERTELYARAAGAAMERLYAGEDSPPRDLLHVTCTGYTSPSAAQMLVAKRGWGRHTRVTHTYHMGCYASMPAIRMAAGLLAANKAQKTDQSDRPGDPRVDIVHNELCTLHMHPADHSPEQLVVQTLFADGHIRYSVVPHERVGGRRALAVLSSREEVLPESEQSMTWAVSNHGMRMTLARDVPARIARAAREFVGELFAEGGLRFPEDVASAIFAIHPGGPKVIDVMQAALELTDAQVAASRDVLFRFGNMSSATLPHIWMSLLGDDAVRPGTHVVSLAFGPGLTVSAALMVKT
jgi:predicted naringenin-chalcone synthase